MPSLRDRYLAVMKPHDLDFEKTDAMFMLRVWDGMDGCWCDCFSAAVTAGEALKKWDRSTLSGTKNVSFHEIDYYRIFPADTQMMWDGSKGWEMNR